MKLFDVPFAYSMGPQRAATSWIDKYLRQHPQIGLPQKVKEVFFFDRHYHKGHKFYQSHFHIDTDYHRYAMEVSTTSFDDPKAPGRLFETFGARPLLICPLRNPIARSFSLYLHYKRYGIVHGTLEEACAQKPQILTSSHYITHLKKWHEVFGENYPIHVLLQEDLMRDQEGFVKKLCNILEIDFMPISEDDKAPYNAAKRSKFPALAGLVQNTGDWLRANRLYGVVNAAKVMGVRDIVFGRHHRKEGDKDMDAPTPEDITFLEEHLRKEMDNLRAYLDDDIPEWD